MSGPARVALAALGILTLTRSTWPMLLAEPQLALVGALITTLLLLGSSTRRAYLVSPFAVAFVGWAALSSVTWSVAPAVSIGEFLGLLALLYMGIIIGSRLTAKEIVVAVMAAQLVVLFYSMLRLLVDPEGALAAGEVLRGIFINRNVFAVHCLIGMIAALAGVVLTRHRRIPFLLSAVTFLGAIVASRSATSTFVAAVVIVVWLLVLFMRRLPAQHRKRGAVGIGVGVTVVGIVLFIVRDSVFALLGRGETLSGRTAIWEVALEAAGQRPLTGFGWAAFWIPANPLYESNGETLGLFFTHAHNSYLEILLQLGVVGVILVYSALVWALVSATRGALFEGSRAQVFNLLIIVLLFTHGLSETLIVREIGLLLLFVVVTRSFQPELEAPSGRRLPLWQFEIRDVQKAAN